MRALPVYRYCKGLLDTDSVLSGERSLVHSEGTLPNPLFLLLTL